MIFLAVTVTSFARELFNACAPANALDETGKHRPKGASWFGLQTIRSMATTHVTHHSKECL